MSFNGIPRSYSYRFRMGGASLGLKSMRRGAGMSLLGSLRSGGLFRLKSGSLLASGSSISKKSIRSSVSKIIHSDKSDISTVDSKVSGGLTKEYVGALETQARKDAKAGVYGQGGKASELRGEQMKTYISPNRDAAIAQVSGLLSSGLFKGAGSNTFRLSGLPYTASVSSGRNGTTAELYDEYGEKFASYDSKGGGWKTVETKAESQFKTASSAIYDEAYRAAQSGTGNGSTVKSGGSGLDIRV